MWLRLLSLGVVVVGSVPMAHAEIDVGTYSVRSFDLLDTYDNLFGELVVTTGEYTGETNLSVGCEHWYWSSTVWPDHFVVEPNAAGDHSIGEPYQRYEHILFPQGSSAMPTVSTAPKAWQVSRIGVGGTSTLDVVLIVDQESGSITWAASSGALDASGLIELADGDQLAFDVISSNPQGMAANSSVRLITVSQL